MWNIIVEIIVSFIPKELRTKARFNLRYIFTYIYLRMKYKNIGKNFSCTDRVKLSNKTTIGDNVILGGLNVRGNGELKIHNNIIIADECLAITSSHNYNGYALPFSEDDKAPGIEIEDHVWVGQRVTLLPGTILREGCIIQAGAVVHGEIPACSIAGGNPAKVFKMRDIEIYNKLKKEYNDSIKKG